MLTCAILSDVNIWCQISNYASQDHEIITSPDISATSKQAGGPTISVCLAAESHFSHGLLCLRKLGLLHVIHTFYLTIIYTQTH